MYYLEILWTPFPPVHSSQGGLNPPLLSGHDPFVSSPPFYFLADFTPFSSSPPFLAKILQPPLFTRRFWFSINKMHSIMVFGNFLNVLNYKSLKIAYHMVTITYICIKNYHKNKLHPGWKFTYIFLNFVKPQPPPFKRPLPLSEFPPFLRKMSNPPLWAPFWKKPSPPFLKGGENYVNHQLSVP